MSETPRYRARMRTEPWIVPGAIAFLRQFIAEHPGCDVLEFGGGASTIWFLRHGCRIVSFEAKVAWRERIINAAANRDIVTEEQAARLDLRKWSEAEPTSRVSESKGFGPDDVPMRLLEWFGPDSFDLVLVDGIDRWACLNKSRPLVRPGGVLMLDNAGHTSAFLDWHWTCCVPGAPDKFNQSDPRWHRFWATAWWQRPGPLGEATYFDVYSEHRR